MRIIAGRFKGRKLQPPVGQDIRPTSDRTRESIFNLLMHGAYAGDSIIDQHVVDLCCGTGALGLEALSRGAASCVFVDQDKKALTLAKDNAIHCGISNACHFIQADVAKLPTTATHAALILMDAPYATPLLAPAYGSLRSGGWLRADTLIVSELLHHATPPSLDGAQLLDSRKYGKAMVHIYRVESNA
jgi:16S rRNA (guanine966-N2)-methyltransferase